jgi:hypothetical protein
MNSTYQDQRYAMNRDPRVYDPRFPQYPVSPHNVNKDNQFIPNLDGITTLPYHTQKLFSILNYFKNF